MKVTNVYRQPSIPPHIRRFEFTNIKSKYSNGSFALMGNELYESTAHTLYMYPFLTKVIPYENITE